MQKQFTEILNKIILYGFSWWVFLVVCYLWGWGEVCLWGFVFYFPKEIIFGPRSATVNPMLFDFIVLTPNKVFLSRLCNAYEIVLSLQTFTPAVPSVLKPSHLCFSPCLFLLHTLYYKSSMICVSREAWCGEPNMRNWKPFSIILAFVPFMPTFFPHSCIVPYSPLSGFIVKLLLCNSVANMNCATGNKFQWVCCQNYVNLLQSNPFFLVS